LSKKKRLDQSKVDVRFELGDLVMYFDHTFDTQGASKLQYLYSGPHVVERKCAQSDNLYWIRRYQRDRSTTPVLEKVNVNRLFLADYDCGDVGPALGWGPDADDLREQPSIIPDAPDDSSLVSRVIVGDMVALRVASDSYENLPFSVGEVIRKKSDTLVVWWYGPAGRGSNISGVWKRGFVDPKDNKRYYHNKRLHRNHSPYTSEDTETELDASHVVGRPFSLVNGKKLPTAILRAASQDPTIPWSLPKH
jgi:hypothetical protein